MTFSKSPKAIELSTDVCTVPKDTSHLTDIYPVVFHDETVEPATNAARAVLTGATSNASSAGGGSGASGGDESGPNYGEEGES